MAQYGFHGVTDGDACGVDDDLCAHRRLVRVADAREVRDPAGPCFGIQSLHIPSLTFLEWRSDVNLHEATAQPADETPRISIRRDEGSDNRDAMSLESARDEPDTAHMSVAFRPREPGVAKEVANGIAIEMLHRRSGRSQLLDELVRDGALA